MYVSCNLLLAHIHMDGIPSFPFLRSSCLRSGHPLRGIRPDESIYGRSVGVCKRSSLGRRLGVAVTKSSLEHSLTHLTRGFLRRGERRIVIPDAGTQKFNRPAYLSA